MTERPYLSAWDRLDTYAHRLHRKRMLPKFVMHWFCYRFDKSLGMFDEDEWEEID